MSRVEEVVAEGRSSVHEAFFPYVLQRLRAREHPIVISERKRFLMLLVGVYGCLCVSTAYVFNLFSGEMQQRYNLTQAELSTITTYSSVLSVIVFPLASLYDLCGPRPLYLIALLTFPPGALLFGLSFADVVQGSVLRFTFYSTLLSVGTSMFDIATLMTIMSVFPSSRGAVIGVMKTFIGLGSAMLSAVQLAFFANSVAYFFYFMAVFVAVVAFLCVLVIELPPYQLTGYEEMHLSDAEKERRRATKIAYCEQVPPPRRFAVGFVVVVVLLFFLPIQSTMVALVETSHATRIVYALVIMAILACYTIVALPIRCLDVPDARAGHQHDGAEDEDDDEVVEPPHAHEDEPLSPEVLRRLSQAMTHRLESSRGTLLEEALHRMPVEEYDFVAPSFPTTFRESLSTGLLWALIFTLFCVGGTQMVVIVNARFIYASISERPMTAEFAALLTAFTGVGSAIGRIAMSGFEMWSQQRRADQRIPLTVALFIPSALMGLCALLLCVGPKELLVLPFVCAALGNGFTAAAVVLVIRALYSKDVATHYNFTSIASIASAIVLNKYLYGSWYTMEAVEQHSTVCVGRQCVQLPFAIMTALCAASMISNYYIHTTYRSFCMAVIGSANHGVDGH